MRHRLSSHPQVIVTHLGRSGAATSDRKAWADLSRAVLPPWTDGAGLGESQLEHFALGTEPGPHGCRAIATFVRTRQGRGRQPTAANCSSSQRHASRGFRARAHFRATDNHSAWPTPYCRNRAPSVRIPLPPECTCSAAPPTIPVRRPAAQSLHNAGPDHFRAAARKSCRTVTGLGAITPRVAARSMRAKPCICVPPWRYA